MAEKNNDVQGLLGVSMDKIKQMVDVNTIIGEPITVPGGTVLIPGLQGSLRLCSRRFRLALQEQCHPFRRRKRGGYQHHAHCVHRDPGGRGADASCGIQARFR